MVRPCVARGFSQLRRHQPSIVTKHLKLATEMMSTDTGLHADQARRQVDKSCLNLATRPLLTQHHRTAPVQTNHVERVLADIDADYGDPRMCCCRRHGVL